MIELYLISVAGSLSIVSVLFAVISGFSYVLLTVVAEANRNDKEDYTSIRKIRKPTGPIFLISLIFAIFCPSQSEMYMIFGVGKVMDYLQESDTAQQLPEKTLNMINKWCDEYLNKETQTK